MNFKVKHKYDPVFFVKVINRNRLRDRLRLYANVLQRFTYQNIRTIHVI
jgi:hypothetical protein